MDKIIIPHLPDISRSEYLPELAPFSKIEWLPRLQRAGPSASLDELPGLRPGYIFLNNLLANKRSRMQISVWKI